MSFTPLGRTLLYTLVASFAHPTLQFGSLFRALRKPADSASRCRDSDENCAMWAATGECAANPSFMFASCLQSCTTCDVEGDSARNRTRAEMRQRLEVGSCYDDASDCESRVSVGGCHDGSETALRCASSCHACGFSKLLEQAYGCVDTDPMCEQWAAAGECQTNVGFMRSSCAKSCGSSCTGKGAVCARPPGTRAFVGPHGIEESMQRILRDFPQYDPVAISRPDGPRPASPNVRAGTVAPWIITLRNFLSEAEVDNFISTCSSHFDRSLAGDQVSPVRTSRQCWCADDNGCGRSALARLVEERVRNVTNVPSAAYMEPFQVLKYEPGQFYKVHHDQNSGWFTPQGVRVFTFFMYLSTVEEGGGTRFADLNLTVPAVKGTAVLWPSVTSADPSSDEPNTNHEGLPPVRGVKYAANAWIHNYDYRTPAKKNCVLSHRNTHSPVFFEP
jgi:hypothetical protein